MSVDLYRAEQLATFAIVVRKAVRLYPHIAAQHGVQEVGNDVYVTLMVEAAIDNLEAFEDRYDGKYSPGKVVDAAMISVLIDTMPEPEGFRMCNLAYNLSEKSEVYEKLRVLEKFVAAVDKQYRDEVVRAYHKAESARIKEWKDSHIIVKVKRGKRIDGNLVPAWKLLKFRGETVPVHVVDAAARASLNLTAEQNQIVDDYNHEMARYNAID